MEFTLVSVFVTLLTVLTLIAVGMWADNAGHLDLIKAKIGAYLAKARASAVVTDTQKKLGEQGSNMMAEGQEKTEAVQDAVGSVGGSLGIGEGEGGLKKRL